MKKDFSKELIDKYGLEELSRMSYKEFIEANNELINSTKEEVTESEEIEIKEGEPKEEKEDKKEEEKPITEKEAKNLIDLSKIYKEMNDKNLELVESLINEIENRDKIINNLKLTLDELGSKLDRIKEKYKNNKNTDNSTVMEVVEEYIEEEA